MCTSPSARCWLIRVLATLLFVLLGLSICSWPDLEAQDPPKGKEDPDKKAPKKEEFDKGGKPIKPLPKDEDEPETKSKVPTPVGGEDGNPRRPRPGKTESLKLEELAREADRPELRDFYQSLAVPQDILHLPGGKQLHVEPIVDYVGLEADVAKSMEVRPLAEDDKRPPVRRVTVRKVEHYEQLALRKVTEFLDKGPLPRLEKLQAAAKALEAVIQYHEAARARHDREGNVWSGPEKELKAKLRTVQLERLVVLTDAKDWSAASSWADELRDKYPDDPKVELQYVKLQVQHATNSLDTNDFVHARQSLEQLQRLFPNEKEAEELRGRLEREAQKRFKQAQQLVAAKKLAEAKDLLAEASRIWPRLPGLQDARLQLDNTYPILRVGVRHVPQHFWPGTEQTDGDRRAVELMFESLVRPRYDPERGQYYEAELAVDRPRVVPLGREFQLIRDAVWSDDRDENLDKKDEKSGKQVTAVDVLRTVQLLKNPQWPGYAPEWADLVEDPRVTGRDPFRISLTLHQGYLDPLSLMTFKILPASLRGVEGLAGPPVGSGPFQYKEAVKDPDRGDVVIFKANHNYCRARKPGLPRIREIHFVHSNDPAVDFKAEPRRLDLLLDLSTPEMKALQEDEALRNRLSFVTLPNRRIYFLAVNHRRLELRDARLRRAIALAFDREQILNRFFRADLKVHRALTGPYPPGSWACKPKAPPLLDPALAKKLLKDINPGELKLTLKYPADDRGAAQACGYVKEQVEQLHPKLKIELEPLSAEELYSKVEVRHDYDLAYCHWDYPSEDYWLWPLLDPRATGSRGRNFLGYTNDGELEGYFRKAMARRQFKAVQQEMYEIHDRIVEQMPFIPLWQLDTHVVFDKDLQPVGIDPLLVFTNVEEWRLEKR
jgi:ABC-type oligopeptide transport system substrate-binding subunit